MHDDKQPIGEVWKKENNHGEYLIGRIRIGGQEHNIVLYPMPYSNGVKPDYVIEMGKKKSND